MIIYIQIVHYNLALKQKVTLQIKQEKQRGRVHIRY